MCTQFGTSSLYVYTVWDTFTICVHSMGHFHYVYTVWDTFTICLYSLHSMGHLHYMSVQFTQNGTPSLYVCTVYTIWDIFTIGLYSLHSMGHFHYMCTQYGTSSLYVCRACTVWDTSTELCNCNLICVVQINENHTFMYNLIVNILYELCVLYSFRKHVCTYIVYTVKCTHYTIYVHCNELNIKNQVQAGQI